MSKTISVLAEATHCTYEVKKSRFIALLIPINTLEDVRENLAQCRQDYPGANHYCWAYFIAGINEPDKLASNDDGEPSGTAGKPIANVLTQNELSHCLAVVVRYFGGVKLGAGGLVRAYSQAVAQAVSHASRKVIEPKVRMFATFAFRFESPIRHLITQLDGVVTRLDYQSQVTLEIDIAEAKIKFFYQLSEELTQGQILIKSDFAYKP